MKEKLNKFNEKYKDIIEKIINNKEIDYIENATFFRDMKNIAIELEKDKNDIQQLNDKERKILYYIYYGRNIYDDFKLGKYLEKHESDELNNGINTKI